MDIRNNDHSLCHCSDHSTAAHVVPPAGREISIAKLARRPNLGPLYFQVVINLQVDAVGHLEILGTASVAVLEGETEGEEEPANHRHS